MDRLFLYLTLGIGALLVATALYFAVRAIYYKLHSVATKWYYTHPNEVEQIRINVDDIKVQINRGLAQVKVRLFGIKENRPPVVVTEETISLAQARKMCGYVEKKGEVLVCAA